ncbi:uncharacterized protein RJT21DRAFT_40455 [Scheffersomyces amazonensis]|uniref:uncharacterized protein n=1 Tax=Scheffersomyces amazonensis TaxID=1078765 RepID=UPI00315D76DD
MTLIDLTSGEPLKEFKKFSTLNSKIPKTQKDTGIRIKWLVDSSELITDEIKQATEIVQNIQDRGQYFKRDKNVIGVLVQSGDEPCAFAGWYGPDHVGAWNVYGDQPKNTQQTYYLGDAETLFVGLF